MRRKRPALCLHFLFPTEAGAVSSPDGKLFRLEQRRLCCRSPMSAGRPHASPLPPAYYRYGNRGSTERRKAERTRKRPAPPGPPLGPTPASSALRQDRGHGRVRAIPGPKFSFGFGYCPPPVPLPPAEGRTSDETSDIHPPPSGPTRRTPSYPNSISHFRGRVNPYVSRFLPEGGRGRRRGGPAGQPFALRRLPENRVLERCADRCSPGDTLLAAVDEPQP